MATKSKTEAATAAIEAAHGENPNGQSLSHGDTVTSPPTTKTKKARRMSTALQLCARIERMLDDQPPAVQNRVLAWVKSLPAVEDVQRAQ